MTIKFTAALRNPGRMLWLAGIFSAGSALAAPQVATPSFSPAGGAYTGAKSVTITSATSGATIAYTTDGSLPAVSAGTVTHGTVYSKAISISDTTTLSAMAFENGYADSAVAIDGYTLAPAAATAILRPDVITGSVQPPIFSLAPGAYSSAQSVTISTTTIGATIIYTTDGSTPAEVSGTPTNTGTTLANGGTVSINATMILKAIAYSSPSGFSTMTSGIYTITSWPRAIVNVIHDFDGGWPNPIGGLIQDSNGNFYGTAAGNNSSNSAVFELTSAYLFFPQPLNIPNGFEPTAALMLGSDGNIYGTTFYGGSTFNGIGGSGDGTVFKMTSNSLTTLASFTGANGSNPAGALVQGSDGNFYGTTALGGTNRIGTVFSVTPTGTLTSLVSFTGTNGAAPVGSLLLYTDGYFYGTTSYGGSSLVTGSNAGYGTVFKMTPSGSLTTLVSFTGLNGAHPLAGLVKGSDGFFYGTTGEDGSINAGTVFEMTPGGSLTTLATFTGANGDQPSAGLVQGTDGYFYGVTEEGGAGGGTIFRTPATGGLTSLASFDIANGFDPSGNLIQGSDGNFYGTANAGGTLNFGTIFQLIVPPGISGATAPAFSLITGTYTSAQTVTITTATSGASIVYTTDGSFPSELGGSITHGTLYSGPIPIGATTTLKALAFKSGMFDSAAASGAYTINIPTSTPPAASGSGGGGAPSCWFLGFLAFAGILRWKLRKARARI